MHSHGGPVAEVTPLTCRQRCTLVTAFLSMLLYCVGFSWVIDVVPQYLTGIVCFEEYNLTFAACKNESTMPLKWRWNNISITAVNEYATLRSVTQARQVVPTLP